MITYIVVQSEENTIWYMPASMVLTHVMRTVANEGIIDSLTTYDEMPDMSITNYHALRRLLSIYAASSQRRTIAVLEDALGFAPA